MSGERTRKALRERVLQVVQNTLDEHDADESLSIDEELTDAILAVLDADPDTPTADAPADTDLREQLARWFFEHTTAAMTQTWDEWPPQDRARFYAKAETLLPLVRAQVEAARRDALNEAADEWLGNNGGAATWLRDRAARGETRQP